MNIVGMILAGNLASLACVVGAIYLASIGVDGWGWFLLASVLVASTIQWDKKPDNKDKNKE